MMLQAGWQSNLHTFGKRKTMMEKKAEKGLKSLKNLRHCHARQQEADSA